MILEALIEYRLCLCVRVGGGFRLRGLCPCCKIHRGDYVHVVKFMGGEGYVHVAKLMGGGTMSTYTNCSRGGGLSGGILSYTEPLRSQTF